MNKKRDKEEEDSSRIEKALTLLMSIYAGRDIIEKEKISDTLALLDPRGEVRLAAEYKEQANEKRGRITQPLDDRKGLVKRLVSEE